LIRIRKQLVRSPQARRLELDVRRPLHFLVNLLRYRGSFFLVAATVSLLAGACIHPHLVLVAIPLSSALYTCGVITLKLQRKHERMQLPVYVFSRAAPKRATQQKRLKRWIQKASDGH